MRKTAPKIVHYKVRPPHTAILDSLGPPTRPHHPAISESATDAAANVGVHFEVVGFESPKSGGCHLAIRNYRGLVGHLRTVPNGSEVPPNGSERFRSTDFFPNYFELFPNHLFFVPSIPPNGSERFRGSLCNLGAPARLRQVQTRLVQAKLFFYLAKDCFYPLKSM